MLSNNSNTRQIEDNRVSEKGEWKIKHECILQSYMTQPIKSATILISIEDQPAKMYNSSQTCILEGLCLSQERKKTFNGNNLHDPNK